MTNHDIGFLGSDGSYSHQAAIALRPDCNYIGIHSFEALITAVETGKVSEAVLPLENSVSGRIPDVHRLVVSMELFFTAELLLSVEHILATSGIHPAKEIKTIFSHPQGFIQSSEFLSKNYPDAEKISKSDTATSIKEMVSLEDPSYAAIGSKFAANLYSANVINEDISNRKNNVTRFVLISRKPVLNSDNNITSLIIQVSHDPGSLIKALSVFGENKINLTKLETYMISDSTRLPTFYLDVGCGSQEPSFLKTMHMIRSHITFSKFLGSYKADQSRNGLNGFLGL